MKLVPVVKCSNLERSIRFCTEVLDFQRKYPDWPLDCGVCDLLHEAGEVQFIDAQAFDLRSIKKTCVHIAHPDGERLIPFDTYNMFYRDGLENTRLATLRALARA